MSYQSSSPSEGHSFCVPPKASRSPCPALNALANHGYISPDGMKLSFFELFGALTYVYNLSYPLALLLTVGAFVTSGTIRFGEASTNAQANPSEGLPESNPINLILPSCLPRVSLDLASLSKRGFFKIAHNASLVHPRDIESTSPHPGLVALFIATACRNRYNSASLASIARFHAARVKSQPIDSVHEQIARGECALVFLVLRGRYPEEDPSYTTPRRPKMSPRVGRSPEMEEMKVNRQVALDKSGLQGMVPAERMEQFFGEERLPDDWWPNSQDGAPGVRSIKTIGLIQVVAAAHVVGQIIGQAVVTSRKSTAMDTPLTKRPPSSL